MVKLISEFTMRSKEQAVDVLGRGVFSVKRLQIGRNSAHDHIALSNFIPRPGDAAGMQKAFGFMEGKGFQ